MRDSSLQSALSIACLAALAACADDRRAPAAFPDGAVRVLVEPLEFDRSRTRLEAVGTSRALHSTELHPATSGEVIAVSFQPGQHVQQDEVLLELDSREEKLAVSLAQLQLEDAERLYERYQRTGSSGAVLPTTIDAARTAVESARIELERAKVALDYRTIEAPFDGYVGITEVDPGDRINPDTLITTLDDRSALLVSFDVPEALVGQLGVGDEVIVAAWSDRGPTAYGEIVDISSRIDPATRTFVARARVGNEADELRPGMSFRVSMSLEGTPYPVIAETAVQWGAEGAYAWSVVNGKAKRINVNIVQRQQGQVLVEADLQEGDLIVVEGIQRMRDGIDVTFDPPNALDRLTNGMPSGTGN